MFVTENQGAEWRRILDGGPGQQQAKDFAKGQGYAIGLAVNPFREGELIVTAGDRPPGLLLKVWVVGGNKPEACGSLAGSHSFHLCTIIEYDED